MGNFGQGGVDLEGAGRRPEMNTAHCVPIGNP